MVASQISWRKRLWGKGFPEDRDKERGKRVSENVLWDGELLPCILQYIQKSPSSSAVNSESTLAMSRMWKKYLIYCVEAGITVVKTKMYFQIWIQALFLTDFRYVPFQKSGYKCELTWPGLHVSDRLQWHSTPWGQILLRLNIEHWILGSEFGLSNLSNLNL